MRVYAVEPEPLRELAGWRTRVGDLWQGELEAFKDYVAHPLVSMVTLSGPTTLLANVIANFTRNVWTHSVIMCGHFPEGVETFELKDIPENETRGEWYVRQMLGSANISGSKFLHVMTGNLSHQIEHHLFPDVPARRYPEMAVEVQAICEKYGLQYNKGPLHKQLGGVFEKIVRLSLPTRRTPKAAASADATVPAAA